MVDVLPGVHYFAGILLRLPAPAFYILCALSAVAFGPLLLGLHAVVGKICSGRHVWVSDCFVEARRNAKQGVALGLFLVITGHLTLWNVFGGLTSSDIPLIALLFVVSRWMSVGFFLFLGLSLPFVCQIITSVEQPIWTAAKNGMILARVYMGRGLLLLLVLGVYWWVTTITIPAISLLSLPLASISLTAFAQSVVSLPLVEKYVLEPIRRQKKTDASERSISSD